MSDDNMKEQQQMIDEFRRTFPLLTTVDDVMRFTLALNADRDRWRNTCSRLVGMMLPFSLLMNKQEQDDLQIILQEAVRGE